MLRLTVTSNYAMTITSMHISIQRVADGIVSSPKVSIHPSFRTVLKHRASSDLTAAASAIFGERCVLCVLCFVSWHPLRRLGQKGCQLLK